MALPRFPTVKDAIRARRTDLPLLCLRPQIAQARAEAFARRFPGTVAYAIKTQCDPPIMQAIGAGLRKAGKPVAFDVASLPEIELARALFPKSTLFFMHPMKKRSAIETAYAKHKVRHFVVDHALEFDKFLDAGVGRDAAVFVRIATPRRRRSEAAYDLSDKFGAKPDEAESLLRRIAQAGYETGIAFHVGSQERDAEPWRASIRLALELRKRSGVDFKTLDIGGGFPGANAEMDAKTVSRVSADVIAELKALRAQGFELIAEPGRTLVYDCMSVAAEIVGKKDATRMGHRARTRPSFYIDDGIWSVLSESATASKPGAPWRWPVSWHTAAGRARGRRVPHYIGGVTCDSVDVLEGEYVLPETLGIGDFIEFGHVGAYGTAITSRFNGFGAHECVIVDQPFRPGT